MNTNILKQQIELKKSMLCVGLDVDLEKIPKHLLDFEDPIFEFNKAIIDATIKFSVAYKPNLAFYEAYGLKGWLALEKTIEYLNRITLKFLQSLMQSVVILVILLHVMPRLFLMI